jgi:hypothetical protein
MAGPCSMPARDRAQCSEHNEIVCALHYHCDMDEAKRHEYITYREWLLRRNRLVTGKTS